MSPHDPQNIFVYTALAVAHYLAGNYPEAVSFGRKAVQQRPGFHGRPSDLCREPGPGWAD